MTLTIRRLTGIVLSVFITVVMLTSCGNKPQIYGQSSTSAISDNNLYGIKESEGYFSFQNKGKQILVEAQALDVNSGGLANPISYDGSYIKLNLDYTNHTSKIKDVTFYIILDGELQPFKVQGAAGELSEYDIKIMPATSKKIAVSLNPVSVSDSADTTMQIVSSVSDDNTVTKYLYNVGDIFLHFRATPGHSVKYNAAPNLIATEYNKPANHDNEKVEELCTPSNGIYKLDMSGSFTKDGNDDGYYNFIKTDQLCIDIEADSNSPVQSPDHRLFLTIDGKLVKAFDGKYSADWIQQKGKFYEFKIDSSVMPSAGRHVFTIFEMKQALISYQENIKIS